MIFSDGSAYAVGFLRGGQENGEGRSGNYGQAVRRTRRAKDHGPQRGAFWRMTAASRRSTDVTASRVAPFLADHHARTQRRLLPSEKIMLLPWLS
jgi:hypothetical protein